MILIGLDGFSGAGKDACADALVAKAGFSKIDLAKPVKQLLISTKIPLTVWDDDGNDIEIEIDKYVRKIGWTEAKKNEVIIRALQFMGDNLAQYFGEAILCDLAIPYYADEKFIASPSLRKSARDPSKGERVIFTNCRRAGERQWVRERGGVIIRIEREGFGPANNHPLEAPRLDYDQLVHNDGQAEDMCRRVLEIASKHYGILNLMEGSGQEEEIELDPPGAGEVDIDTDIDQEDDELEENEGSEMGKEESKKIPIRKNLMDGR